MNNTGRTISRNVYRGGGGEGDRFKQSQTQNCRVYGQYFESRTLKFYY